MVAPFSGFLFFPCVFCPHVMAVYKVKHISTHIYSDTHSSQYIVMSVPDTNSRCAFAWHLVAFISYWQLFLFSAVAPHVDFFTLHTVHCCTKFRFAAQKSCGMADEATSVMSPLSPRITVSSVYNAARYTIWELSTLPGCTSHVYIHTLQSSQQRCGFPKVLHVMEGIPQDLLLSPCHNVCNCFWRKCDLCMEYLLTRIHIHDTVCM